ncbi:hypothetical protein P167DRAFT_539340 [Morchella conica CCBAS932]|uniref:Uncharacterized protein n=1 Tax=Morchella conica CCBAS932 TaxID=1392247 RepID=A0A3N4KGE9_9PEZI|nr:hypothetical protein P167DRAFT_539340 [Morchella conica CCBAS932]
MNTDPHSPPSPGSTTSESPSNHYSEVPTEPIPASEILRWNEHMTRRKHFLSDYERYNPVQNMHALANHVFDLSESVHSISDQVAVSGRTLGFVQEHTRDTSESLRSVGEELTRLKGDVEGLKGEIGELRGLFEESRRETQQGFAELKGMMQMLMGLRA